MFVSPEPDKPDTEDNTKLLDELSQVTTFWFSEAPGDEKPTSAKSSKLASAILASALALVKYKFVPSVKSAVSLVANQVLAVKIPDSNGAMHDFWIKYAEVEYWQQWYRELERGYWYSRSTDTVLDATGRPINSGPGLQEQLEDCHTEYYSHLTTQLSGCSH